MMFAFERNSESLLIASWRTSFEWGCNNVRARCWPMSVRE